MVALIIAFLVVFVISGSVAASAGPRAVVEYLSSLESRVAGYPGSAQAAKYVEERLQALGLATRRDSFAVVVPIDKGGRLEWEDESVALYAVWPNGARTSTVPPEGLRVPAIWGGDGDWGDFNGQEVAGRVVVLDFASGDAWLKAASLGAAGGGVCGGGFGYYATGAGQVRAGTVGCAALLGGGGRWATAAAAVSGWSGRGRAVGADGLAGADGVQRVGDGAGEGCGNRAERDSARPCVLRRAVGGAPRGHRGQRRR